MYRKTASEAWSVDELKLRVSRWKSFRKDKRMNSLLLASPAGIGPAGGRWQTR
jgi:hypothetical protein